MDFAHYLETVGEFGFVEEVIHSLVTINGLPGSKPQEIIIFESGEIGEVFSVESNSIKVLLFSNSNLKVGTKAARTNQVLQVSLHEELLGRIIDPLGNLIDIQKPFDHHGKVLSRPLDIRPLGISHRARIQRSFETGVSVVDLMVPLGKGQRELVMGDKKTGKSNFLLKSVLTQAIQGTVCVYAAIGKKKMDIKKTKEFFEHHKVSEIIVTVATTSQDSPGLIFLTPYTAMTIAEYFRDLGRDVLVVLDDLTTHAKYYRQISLLGKRFPGKNSYPGDIFFIHAKLLERAGNFKTEFGEAAITCLPVAETTQSDLTGYIQTNLMAMTDGHIFFDTDLYTKGRRPAVNPFLSVTRIGKQTQTVTKRELNRELVSFLNLYEKMQNFIHFGAELSENIKLTLSTGEKILSFFDQSPFTVIPPNIQMVLFCMLWSNAWEGKDVKEMKKDMDQIVEIYKTNEILRKIVNSLVDQSSSFNQLINKAKTASPEILTFIQKTQN